VADRGWARATDPSSRTKPIMVCAAAREVAVAEGKIYARDFVESRYAQGVLHALRWAQYATALPPVRLESRSVAVVDHRARIADHAAGWRPASCGAPPVGKYKPTKDEARRINHSRAG